MQDGPIKVMGVPEGLTALEYSRHILEFELCWPTKSNIELIADCISAISKGKKLPLDKAYKYLARAISLAREQGVAVDRMFFLNGDYMNMRPQRESGHMKTYKPMTAEEKRRLAEDQASPAYQELVRKMDDLLKKLAGQTKMEAK